MNAIVPSDGLALRSLDDHLKLAEAVSKSGIFGSAAQCLIKILAGRELGFGVVASLTDIHVTPQGKLIVGAHLRAAAIRGSGRYDFRVKEHTDAACEIEFLRKDIRDLKGGWEVLGSERLTLQQAKDRGWTTGKPTWEKTPKNMLFARVMVNGYRWHCPDLSSGVNVYDPDELDSNVVDAEYAVQERATVNGPLQKIEVPAPAPAPITQTARQATIPPVVETLSPEQQDALALVFRDRKRTPQDMETLLASRGVHTLQQLPKDLYEWAHDILANGQIDQAQSDRIAALVTERGYAWQDIGKRLQKKFGVDRLKLLTRPQADEIEKALQPKVEA